MSDAAEIPNLLTVIVVDVILKGLFPTRKLKTVDVYQQVGSTVQIFTSIAV